jgi:DNA-binding LacI/PurR family transcriptional regulator
MPKPFATIRDVAREAGVSISTVSSVLNGNKPVSEELGQRVRAAVEKLDFRPNQMAQSLGGRRTQVLAYLTPDISNVAFIRTFKAVEAVARSRGYTLVLINTEGSVEVARQAIIRAIGLRVDGVFLTLAWSITHADAGLSELSRRGIQLVGVDGSYPQDWFDCFLHDEEAAGRQLAAYLKRLGHEHVLCVGPRDSRASERRWAGFSDTFNVHIADVGGYSAQSGYDAMHKAIAEGWPFTAVVTFNDAYATGALAALNDQGLSVPDDISFASFGDQHRDFARPRITSMTFEEVRIAELAANRLIDRIEGAFGEQPGLTYLPLSLSLKNSSQKLHSPNRRGRATTHKEKH